ncbi:MAG: thioredoxin [bacterium]
MSESNFIIELDPENFEQVVFQGSLQVPVLVDFWADWCQPCKTLMPVLSKLAEEYQGKFILAKLNTEQHQELAAQFGIRSLPTIKLFKQGQPVDEFMGALPEPEIRAFLDKHIERESDAIIAQAHQALLQGDSDTAMTLLWRAKELDPENTRVSVAMAQTHAALGDAEAALDIVNQLPADDQELPEIKALCGHLHFETLAEGKSVEGLQQQLKANPNDHRSRLELAALYVAEEQYEAALQQLLELMRKDSSFQDGAAKHNMIRIFEILGDDPLVSSYRSKMMSLIY